MSVWVQYMLENKKMHDSIRKILEYIETALKDGKPCSIIGHSFDHHWTLLYNTEKKYNFEQLTLICFMQYINS